MLCYAVFISLYVYVNVLCDAMPGYEKLWYVYYVCSECSAVQWHAMLCYDTLCEVVLDYVPQAKCMYCNVM